MIAINVPDLPNHPPTILVAAKADKNQLHSVKRARAMAVCEIAENVSNSPKKQFPIEPFDMVRAYFAEFEKRIVEDYTGNLLGNNTSTSTVIEKPKHGKLIDDSYKLDAGPVFNAYKYEPEDGFVGQDEFVIDSKINVWKVRLHYRVHVVDGSEKYRSSRELCGESGFIRKISSLPTDPISLASLQRSNDLATILASASNALTNFTNLPGAAVGETTGTGNTATITLDTNAAGHHPECHWGQTPLTELNNGV